MASPEAIMAALAAAVDVALGDGGTADPLIENLQVTAYQEFNPTAPCVDVYPADPFLTPLAMSNRREQNYIVRVRVGTPDNIAGQQLLLSMMDPDGALSVTKALRASRTLAGTVGYISVGDVSGYSQWPLGPESQLLGATWNVTVYP